jgi:hypothetical protein
MRPNLQTLTPKMVNDNCTSPRLVRIVLHRLPEDTRYGGVRGEAVALTDGFQRGIAFGKNAFLFILI